MRILGVDTGGTFTDFVYYDGERLHIRKVLSTPEAPEQAILTGIAALGLEHQTFAIVHGSTVATNAVLEGKGVKTAYITNYGLGDVLTIARQTRRQLYALQPAATPPPVPAELCFETGGRLDARGRVVEDLSDTELDTLAAQIRRAAPQAVAINLLFSFLDPRFEEAIAARLPASIFVSRSSEVLPEYREYERGITTWLNAWVGPLVERYLKRLTERLPRCTVSVMQSSGGTLLAEHAGRQAVHMLLSGPAGGLAGARHVAALSGRRRLMSFDMGGTSTDVALLDGELRLTHEGRIGPYPVGVAMVDMHTIGAGGGSIAYLDGGGVLQVGPESAGAVPGPACYGRGGLRPTVTDANVVLGRLPAQATLGGSMRLDAAAGRRALATLAAPLRLSIEEAAAGVIRIANEHMAQALRLISVQRGFDPGDFTLVCFGGAGGLHVCALADALNMRRALVPIHAGVLSALGMLAAPHARQLARTVNLGGAELGNPLLERRFAELAAQGVEALGREGIAPDKVETRLFLDMRYRGQSYLLTVPWTRPDETLGRFHALHEQRYGHRLELEVEIVNVRVAVRGPEPPLRLPPLERGGGPACAAAYTALYGVDREVAIHRREGLRDGDEIDGPALVIEDVATTYIARGWRGEVDHHGNLLLARERPD